MMELLKIIPVEHLPKLRDSYTLDWPLHISTHSTVQVFIDRFAKHREWADKVKFLSLENDWSSCGAFIMTHENRIFFNTLEKFPFERLWRALLMLEFDEDTVMTLVNIRDALRPLIFQMVRVHHLKIVCDIGTKCYILPKTDLQKLDVQAPDGFELKPVREDHVKKINSAWPGRFKNSEKFLEDLIEQNPSMGMYNINGELIAWNIRLDSGSMGVGQVDSNYEGNLYGHLAVIALAVKIAKDFNTDVHFEIVNGNTGAEQSAKRSELTLIDTQSWVSLRKREKLAKAPLWGHL